MIFFIYANDLYLVGQHKDINKIKNQLTEDFFNTCDWFVNNEPSLQFGEDMTKTIFLLLNLKGKI